MRRVAETWLEESLDKSRTPPSLPPMVPLPAHGTVVLVSDWLDPLDRIESVIRHYASAGVRGHIVQVLDPARRAFGATMAFDVPAVGPAVLEYRTSVVRPLLVALQALVFVLLGAVAAGVRAPRSIRRRRTAGVVDTSVVADLGPAAAGLGATVATVPDGSTDTSTDDQLPAATDEPVDEPDDHVPAATDEPVDDAPAPDDQSDHEPADEPDDGDFAEEAVFADEPADEPADGDGDGDRKSTRLNSSHRT